MNRRATDAAASALLDPPDTRDELLTSQEVRSLLKIGRTKLWELTKRDDLPAYRIGTGSRAGLRYKRSDLLRWLDRNRV